MRYYCTSCGAVVNRPKRKAAYDISVVGVIIVLLLLFFAPIQGFVLAVAAGLVWLFFRSPTGEKVAVCPKCGEERSLVPCPDEKKEPDGVV